MLELGNYLFQGSELIVVPPEVRHHAIAFLRFLGSCFLLGLVAWTVISAWLDAIVRARRMHQIPCSKCRFFTNDYRIKCTVRPKIANTEAAIDCSDYISN